MSTAMTATATEVLMTTAMLNGTVNTNDEGETMVSFQLGVTVGYGNTSTATQSPLANGTSEQTVSTTLKRLSANTTYYYRIKAKNTGGTAYGEDKTFMTEAAVVSDIDGNEYSVVQIGNQFWTAENLKVTHYRNGDSIPNVIDSRVWSNTSEGAWCCSNNDPIREDREGKLYNWFAVTDLRGLAPEGWYISSKEEYETL